MYRDAWDYQIREALRDQFIDDTYNNMKWLVTMELNPLKRIVDEISLIYKKPATRRCVDIKMVANDEGKEIETAVDNENYELAMEDTEINAVQQSVNTYTNLINHTLQKVEYKDGKISFEVINFNNCEIYTDPDDWKTIDAIKYYTGLELPTKTVTYEDNYAAGPAEGSAVIGGGLQNYHRAYIHTGGKPGETISHVGLFEGEDVTTLEAGKVYTIEAVNGFERIVNVEDNPYMTEDRTKFVLPFVLYNRQYPIDDLLCFTSGNDRFDANINTAINMVHLNMLIKYQSYKQTVFILDNKDDLPKDIRLDPAVVVTLSGQEGKTDAKVLDLQANIDMFWDNIQKRIQQVMLTYNVSPQNFTASGSAASGLSQMISNQGKIEAREQQLEAYRIGEKALFEVVRVVWNEHKKDKQIPWDSKFSVDFAEIEFPKSGDEQIKEDEFYKAHNIITDIDIMVRENPDLSREQAENQLRENQKVNEANRALIAPLQQPEDLENETLQV
jgi:hypothetical protein